MSVADLLEAAGLRVLRHVPPETAHGLALCALRLGLGAGGGPITSPRLALSFAGIRLPNPLGIAAGFDKDAEAVRALLAAGPGFVEIGAVTPRPQPGNPRPRLFRLPEDGAAINRFGFNSKGMSVVRQNLLAARAGRWGDGVIGVNLGANKESPDRSEDYAQVLARLYDLGDFFTVNVSSPNTERLRALQGRDALTALLERVLARRDALDLRKPVFLKIAPDLDDREIADIAAVALESGLDGLVATNTTTRRDGLKGRHRQEAGGLSGRPLLSRSTEVVRKLYRLTEGQLPIVGVGGVGSGADAYSKIRAGATAVQLYTALAYGGLAVATRILTDLEDLLAADGFENVTEAVGADS
ncbi:MAG: quinone-dependent dihydroorotate dehydrogenase [Pikeienuella sp.]